MVAHVLKHLAEDLHDITIDETCTGGKKTAGHPEILLWDKILKFKNDARIKTFKKLKENASNLSEWIGLEL